MPKPKSKESKAKTAPKKGEAAEHARNTVYVEKSVTKNMGDYNSARVSIGMTVPVDPTDDELNKLHEAATIGIEIVDELLTKEITALED